MSSFIFVSVYAIASFIAIFLFNRGLKVLEDRLPVSIFKRKLAQFNRVDKIHTAAVAAALMAILAHLTNLLIFRFLVG